MSLSSDNKNKNKWKIANLILPKTDLNFSRLKAKCFCEDPFFYENLFF